MKIEEGWKMYIKIKDLKQRGFSNRKIAKMLGISRPTVIKYVNMSADDFEREMQSQRERTKKADKYYDDILGWLKQYPSMTSAQIYDWLEEKYHNLNFNETTLRNFVRVIKEEYNILKEPIIRQYEAVDDPPMGKQMQVDFGQKNVINRHGSVEVLHVMCFVLSNSRYKYYEWQGRPFNTEDIINIHENAFEYFGGFPEEAVYDQDHLILVSENHGDLIYTKEFAAYLQRRKFNVYMCRRSDPESKGRVEKVVDFVKGNFASNRIFYGIDKWNDDCLKWLKRRGNGKVHTTTRKIPAEVFIEEKKYLQPVTDKIISKPCILSIAYQVRKDNTVPIKGNRYTIPKGTYKGPNTYVGVTKFGIRHLRIYEIETGKELAIFEIPDTKGNLVINNDHKRDKSQKVSQLIKRVANLFSESEKAEIFLEEIHRIKPRYIRDQLTLIEASISSSDMTAVNKALNFCVKNNLPSAVDFRDAVRHYSISSGKGATTQSTEISGLSEAASSKIAVKPKMRDISEYIKIMKGNGGEV